MRILARLAVAIAVLAALPLHAATQRVVLGEPRDGAVLRGGAMATIDWSAETLPREAEEWEAFLSVDGGRHYAYRITPHLGIEHRRFSFEVPNFGTGRARILIRVGDEEHETGIVLPATFAIEQSRDLAAATLSVDEDERGEAARPGERGVVEWIDGDREGRRLEHRTALRHTRSLHAPASARRDRDAACDATLDAPLRLLAAPRTAPPDFPDARIATNFPGPPARGGRDLLLVARRLNI